MGLSNLVNAVIRVVPNEWSLLTVSSLKIEESLLLVEVSLDGRFETVSIPASRSAITSFRLGASFRGFMRDFIFYKCFMGTESFSDPSACKLF